MVCHVSCEDHTDHALSEQLFFVLFEAFNEVALLFEKDLERFRCVPVLLHCLVMVSQCPICHKVDMIGIVKAIMFIVMTGGCDDR